MKNFLISILLFSYVSASVPPIPDPDDFTLLELQKIAQSGFPIASPKPTIVLPVMSVKFEIIINGDSILYSNPIFTLDGIEVLCQVCGSPPCQIEMLNGKLKCFCFNHIPKRTRSDVWS